MHAGVLAQMAQNSFPTANGLGMPSGLASRRGGQKIKPLSFDAIKPSIDHDKSVPTPRTSRSHLLAGLRTAPKSATAANFPASPTTSQGSGMLPRNQSISGSAYSHGPKTSMPRIPPQHPQHQQAQQQQAQYLQQWQQQQQQHLQMQQIYNSMGLQYTVDQVLAPPQLDQLQEQMDPATYAELVATNYTLGQQRQKLTQHLTQLQAQLQGLSVNALQQQQQLQQQQYALYQQQLQLQNAQQNIYAYVDPITGQQTYVVDSSPVQMTKAGVEHSLYPQLQQQQQLHLQQVQLQQAQLQQAQLQQAQLQQAQQLRQAQHLQQAQLQEQQQEQQLRNTPHVQVSPPPSENAVLTNARNKSPPGRFDSPVESTPLPTPSANPFRRGHKKFPSINLNAGPKAGGQDFPASAGPRTASFPPTTPATHGPGQGRAGEHPIREPRGPPQTDELRAAPTSKHPGSKNFIYQARRFAVNNLVRAGMERRKGTASSTGSMTPVSESAEELETPLTDNDSDSGRSGSGSLAGNADCQSSSTRGSWGAIGSDRPSSRSKARDSLESSGSTTSPCESDSSFAGVFKKGQQPEQTEPQRKATRLVLTSAEKRRNNGVSLS